jgi:hypothetical protein
MYPGCLPPPLPRSLQEPRHAPPLSYLLSGTLIGLAAAHEPPIRRYSMQWLQQAAARVHRRTERSHRQNLFAVSVLGIDHLFDMSDVQCVDAEPLGLA